MRLGRPSHEFVGDDFTSRPRLDTHPDQKIADRGYRPISRSAEIATNLRSRLAGAGRELLSCEALRLQTSELAQNELM